MTKRGWVQKDELITTAEADAFMARCQESHAVRWQLRSVWFVDGEEELIADDLPVTGGTLTLDSSDPIRRRLSVTIGGGEDWIPTSPSAPLAPYGQRLILRVSIDMRDGSWTPWFKMFEGPIRETVFEEPSLIVTCEAADFGSTLEEFLHERKKSYAGMTLEEAVTAMVDAALPAREFAVEASEEAQEAEVTGFVAEAGQSRLEAAQALTAKFGHELFFDWSGDAIIRPDLTDDDDEAWDPAQVGPDIGDTNNPVAEFRTGEGGNLVGMTSTLSREQACNGVVMNLTALVNKPKTAGGTPASKEIWWTHAQHVTTGPLAYGDDFGRIPIVETTSVHKLNDDIKNRRIRRAKKLLQRRRGLIKYLDFDALPLYWLEPDDRVRIPPAVGHYDFYIQRIEFDLAGGPMRCRTRTMSAVWD